MAKQYISTDNKKDFCLYISEDAVFNIYHSENINPIIRRATEDVMKDINTVTGATVALINNAEVDADLLILTLDDLELINSFGLNVEDLQGKWEHYLLQTIHEENGKYKFIIVGSDARGAVYGLYDLSNEIGVTPWHWWLDVPIIQQKNLYLKQNLKLLDGPKVKYRGIFLNDEGPSLMTWVRSYFGDFNHQFYEKIFELLLRLKGNYLWPAMWDSTFYEDDEENIRTADRYGVVIGTSHHEPMNRPHGDWKKTDNGPWNYQTNKDFLKEFWSEGIDRSKDYETIINLGMRGDGDEPLNREDSVEDNKLLMEKIIKDQRDIIASIHEDNNHSQQMWALYKEVKELYDLGMDIPEDVIMLWGDDNWGNIRRLPTLEESNRLGGTGIYYHFDYVGGPRSYKWIGTVPIEKTWEQMDKAFRYQANSVWIVNVGDLKPMEYFIDFFLKMAWDPERFNPNNLQDFPVDFSKNIFKGEYSDVIVEALTTYSKYNGRIKPELLNTVDLYSWKADFEAERELEKFKRVIENSESFYSKMSLQFKDTYFQLVHYPLLASYKVLKLQLLVNLHQHLTGMNAQESIVIEKLIENLFLEDRLLTYKYNEVLSEGKWRHMMDQIHIGYSYWNQPNELKIPELAKRDKSNSHSWFALVKNGNHTHSLTKKIIYIDVWNSDDQLKKLTISTPSDWLKTSEQNLNLATKSRFSVAVDWDKLQTKEKITANIIISDGQDEQQIPVVIDNRPHTVRRGYIPENNIIALEGASYTKAHNDDGYDWTEILNYGRTKSSMGLYPVRMEEKIQADKIPYLEYIVNLFEDQPIKVKVFTAPSLPFWDGKNLSLNISFDGVNKIVSTGDLTQNGEQDSPDWEKAVIYNVHEFIADFHEVKAGEHTLRIGLLNSQLLIQKIVIEQGTHDKTLLGQTPSVLFEELKDQTSYSPVQSKDYSLVDDERTTVSSKSQYILLMTDGWYDWTQQKKIKLLTFEKINKVTKSSITKGIFMRSGLYRVDNPERLDFEIERLKSKAIGIDVQLASGTKDKQSKQRLDVVIFNRSKKTHRVGLKVRAYTQEGKLVADWSTTKYVKVQGIEHLSGTVDALLTEKIARVIVQIEEDDISYQEEVEM